MSIKLTSKTSQTTWLYCSTLASEKLDFTTNKKELTQYKTFKICFASAPSGYFGSIFLNIKEG